MIAETVCHLPATWDHLATSFASGMGPPPLPVMGPPRGSTSAGRRDTRLGL